MTEEIFSGKIKYKGRFDIKELYKFLHDWLEEKKWKDTQFGEDKYEKYYYERITREGLKFYEIQWEACKNFNEENPKVDHYLKIKVLVIAYNPQTQTGDLEVSIKAKRVVESTKEPKATSESEKLLEKVFKVKSSWLYGIYVKKEEKKILKESKKKLFNDANKLKSEIQKFLGQYAF